jgi:hypothetical protein
MEEVMDRKACTAPGLTRFGCAVANPPGTFGRTLEPTGWRPRI